VAALALVLLGPEPGSLASSAEAQVTRVVVSREGFRPSRLNARRGERLRLSLETTDREHCFALDAFRVEKRVVAGRKTAVELVPDRAGTFPFYSCLDPGDEKLRGSLVVVE
jgi:heme/copper-type cytochrome/quinol oxidase subunit 2